MRRRDLILLSLAALTIALMFAIVTWRKIPQAEPPAIPLGETVDPARMPDPLPGEPEAISVTPGVDRILTVRVKDDRGATVPGARVSVIPDRSEITVPLPGEPEVVAHTDGDGIARMPLSRRVQHRVEVVKDGYARASVAIRGLDAEVVLNAGARLTGRVMDADSGDGLPGVRLELVRDGRRLPVFTGISDEMGEFRLRHLSPGRYVVTARTPAHLDRSIDIELSPGAREFLELPVATGLSIEGLVVEKGTGIPLTEGIVRVTVHTLFKSAEIGPDGRFRLAGLMRSPSFYKVHAPGWHSNPVSAKVLPRFDPATGRQTREALLEAIRGTVVEGRVVDETGAPVAGARIVIGFGSLLYNTHKDDRMSEFWRDRSHNSYTLSNEDGRFALTRSSRHAGTSCLVVHRDHAPCYMAIPHPFPPEGLVVTLSPGSALVVKAADESGRPEVGAEVRTLLIDPKRGEMDRCDVLGAVIAPPLTDGSGRAELPHLSPGRWLVEVWSADDQRLGATRVRVGEFVRGAIKVRMRSWPPVEGIVRDQDGEPVEGAFVNLVQDPLPIRSTRTDAAGGFTFTRPRLMWNEEAHHIHVSGAERATVAPGEFAEITVVRNPQRPARKYRVVDDLTGWEIAFGRWESVIPDPRGNSVTSNFFRYGRFEAKTSRRNGSTLTVEARGYAERTLDHTSVPEEGVVCEVRLSPSTVDTRTRLLVQVKTPGKHAWVREVRLYDAETRQALPSGRWVANGVRLFTLEKARPVLITVQGVACYLPEPHAVTPRAGKETEVVLTLSPSTGLLRGTAPEGAKSLVLVDPHGLERKLHLTTDRTFLAGSLGPGVYELVIDGEKRTRVPLAENEKVAIALAR